MAMTEKAKQERQKKDFSTELYNAEFRIGKNMSSVIVSRIDLLLVLYTFFKPPMRKNFGMKSKHNFLQEMGRVLMNSR